MIVKFRANGAFGECWEFVFDVTSFSHSKINKEQRESGDILANDYIQRRDRDGKIEEGAVDYIYFQAWHTRSLDPINIITNMPVYILNDEGKTVEKVN